MEQWKSKSGIVMKLLEPNATDDQKEMDENEGNMSYMFFKIFSLKYLNIFMITTTLLSVWISFYKNVNYRC